MNNEAQRQVAALRHALHINSRLRLEFLAGLSKLFREHEVVAGDQLLSSLILAVPDELMNGNGHGKMQAADVMQAGAPPESAPPEKMPQAPPESAPPEKMPAAPPESAPPEKMPQGMSESAGR